MVSSFTLFIVGGSFSLILKATFYLVIQKAKREIKKDWKACMTALKDGLQASIHVDEIIGRV
jgi:hypothetical protein